MWMGAHPLASSSLTVESPGNKEKDLELIEFISADSKNVLGPDITREYGRLPFLFKLLAAGESLSIQAHPDKKTAEEGFEREDRAGIPRDAPERNYRDDNHKPEIIMAVTEFSAMIGFRNPRDIFKSFAELSLDSKAAGLLAAAEKTGRTSSSGALRIFLEGFLTLEIESRTQLLDSVSEVSESPQCSWTALQRHWVNRLVADFPGDIGALAPLLLHLVVLKPGEALYQPPGSLHAYLEGFGVELMANSDNVLRGGLTEKHIDVQELLKILSFEASEPAVLEPGEPDRQGIRYYPVPVKEFALGLTDCIPGKETVLQPGSGPLIILVMSGEIHLSDGRDEAGLKRGESAFIPWNAGEVRVSGNGRAVFASVGGRNEIMD
jgi:mannose-6-phosphate isomerase